jgi:hypothetical protein
MRQVIKDTFFDFSAQREGFTPFMYCDTLNLVTTGIGNLIDNGARNGFDISENAMAPAMNLPWKFKGPGWTSKNPVAAGPASKEEIREAWTRTKLREQSEPGFNKRGGFAYAGFQPLTLDLQGLKELFNRTLTRFDSTISQRYPGYETWPADAQQAILSMAWAMGPAFNFPAFKAAVDKLDFRKAAELSFFKGGGGTLENRTGRNRENVIMFTNAADVLKAGVDPDRLFFPGTVGSSSGVGPTGGGGAGIANISGSNPRIGDVAIIGGGVAAIGWAGWELFKHYGRSRR